MEIEILFELNIMRFSFISLVFIKGFSPKNAKRRKYTFLANPFLMEKIFFLWFQIENESPSRFAEGKILLYATKRGPSQKTTRVRVDSKLEARCLSGSKLKIMHLESSELPIVKNTGNE